jgi:hypothetical protein
MDKTCEKLLKVLPHASGTLKRNRNEDDAMDGSPYFSSEDEKSNGKIYSFSSLEKSMEYIPREKELAGMIRKKKKLFTVFPSNNR